MFTENQMRIIQMLLSHCIVMTWNCSVIKKNKILTPNPFIEWMVFKFEDQKPVLQEIGADFLLLIMSSLKTD